MSLMPRQKAGLSFHDVDKEVICYDTERELAYCLNPTAAQVIKMCDGKTTVEEARSLMGTAPASGDLLSLTLKTLDTQKLLADPIPDAGMDRRAFISKWGKVAVALPLVAMVAAPHPAAAASSGPDSAGNPGVSDDTAHGGAITGPGTDNGDNDADPDKGTLGADDI